MQWIKLFMDRFGGYSKASLSGPLNYSNKRIPLPANATILNDNHKPMNTKLRITLKVAGLFATAVFIRYVVIPFGGAVLYGAIKLNVYLGAFLILLIPFVISGWWVYREYKKVKEEESKKGSGTS